MRKILVMAAVGVLATAGVASAAAPAPKTDDEKTIYTLGFSIGQGLGIFSLTPQELEVLKQGLSDAVTKQKAQVEISQYEPKIEALAKSRSEARVPIEKQKGNEFAEKVAKEKGAKKYESGLVVKELKPGKGPSPKPTDTVKVHYRGTLVDGTEFDSSYARNEPAEFPLNGVIPCWTEGLQKMKVGGKAQLVCPSSIAYGDRGRPKIPGGATLVFEVELLEIKPPPAAPAPAPAPGKK